MSIRIDRNLCNGCGNAVEGKCAAVCPGDLLYKDSSNRCSIREPKDCWDCASCIKECPRQAIEMYLPAQIGGCGATLTARRQNGRVVWKLKHPNGAEEIFELVTHNF